MTSADRVVGDLGRAIDHQDWDGLHALLAPDFSCRYVHTGEVLGRDAYVRLNREYPGAWRFTVRDDLSSGDRACGLAVVTDGRETHHVALFLTVRDGLVRDAVEVWAEQTSAPQDRRPG